MTSPFVPFGMSDDEREAYAVLRDGVPPQLREPLLEWVTAVLDVGNGYVRISSILDMQNVLDVDLGVRAGSRHAMSGGDFRGLLRDATTDLECLRIVDYLLSGIQNPSRKAVLQAVLSQGRSRWTVGGREGRPGLVERVPQGVQDSVEGVIDAAGSAGKVLAKAWSEVHGLQPQDSSAYSYAVRAVEIAATGVVMPKKHDATLGTVIGQMKADGDWRLPFREHPEAQSAEVVLGMLRTLWVGHRDRHGSADYSDVTHDEARAAVTLAATLVDWFASGAVQRRTA
jgi:hypothetical protein